MNRAAATFALAIIVGLSACDSATEPAVEKETVEPRAAVTLRTVYTDHLDHLREGIESGKLSPYDADGLLDATVAYYEQTFGTGSRAHSEIAEASAAYLHDVATFEVATDDLPAHLRILAEAVDEAVDVSTDFAAFTEYLQQLQTGIAERNWSEQEQAEAWSYLILMEETMRFLDANAWDWSGDTSEMIAAWRSALRCAMGITGGAILGGLTGAAAGTAVPAIGTTAGGVVGAVGGGLSGAAATCFAN